MCYTSKQTRNSPFLKVRRNITSMPEMADLLNEEGSTGFGTYMMILIYLTKCDNCVGLYNKSTLRSLSVEAHKSLSYIRNIINNYGLFVVDDKAFYSQELCQTLNIDFTVNSDSKEDEPELNHCSNSNESDVNCSSNSKRNTSKKDANKLNSNSIENDSKLNHNSIQNESRLNHESIQNQRNGNKHNTYTHAQPREDIDIDIDKDIDIETTAIAVVKAEAPSDFLAKMNLIFNDYNWLRTLEGETGIKLFSDNGIRQQVIEWFDKRLIMSGSNDESGYKPRDAKKYLRNLLISGRKTRNEFNELLKRNREKAKRKALLCPPDNRTSGPSEYETVVGGVRYARQKESVPMSAPPQDHVYRRWSCIRNEWVAPDQWNFEMEMMARKEMGMPNKLLIL